MKGMTGWRSPIVRSRTGTSVPWRSLQDRLGDEGHDRVEQPHRAIQDRHERGLRGRPTLFPELTPQARLDHLQIPVGNLSPEESMSGRRRLVEPESLERLGDL